jgi:hypothetical protein
MDEDGEFKGNVYKGIAGVAGCKVDLTEEQGKFNAI